MQAAKDFLVWLMDPKQVERWYDLGRQLLRAVPARLRRRAAVARGAAQPAVPRFADAPRTCPAGRRRSAASHSESVAKYVVVDMFAKACAGKSTKEVIADAVAQLKQIYKAGLSVSSTQLCRARRRRRYRAAPPAVSLRRWTERRGRVQLADGDPARAVPAGAGGIPVRLRHLAQPGGPAGRARRPRSSGSANFMTDLHDPGVLAGGAEHVRLYLLRHHPEDGRRPCASRW